MNFDSSEVNIGDSVFDVAYGSGTVFEVAEKIGVFGVNFGGKKFFYKPNGFGTFNRKTLFWREPIGRFVPMKDDGTWHTFCTLREAIAQALSKGI